MDKSELKIVNPEYVKAAESFDREADLSGVAEAALKVIEGLDPDHPLLKIVMKEVEDSAPTYTPDSTGALLAEIGEAVEFTQSQKNTCRAQAEDCLKLATQELQHGQIANSI